MPGMALVMQNISSICTDLIVVRLRMCFTKIVFTFSGMLLSMPGFIGNYRLPITTPDHPTKVFNSLGCKLVTVFPKNAEANPPKPKIMANIVLVDANTGELKAIIEATEITAWRTAAASIVATKHLYFNRQSAQVPKTLAILGCGVQV